MSQLKIAVNTAKQEALLLDGDHVLRRFVVSTAANGLGCEEGSYKTPTGRFKIAKKIGDGAPLGAIFKGRVPTGEVWTNTQPPSKEDLILTRILWLEGLEPQNANTFQRYIYFHGTNHEDLLGSPASHGCIRMGNLDVVELFDRVPEGTPVEIN